MGAVPAGRCPPLVSTFSFGGDDMFAPMWSLRRETGASEKHKHCFILAPEIADYTSLFKRQRGFFSLPELCLETVRNDVEG